MVELELTEFATITSQVAIVLPELKVGGATTLINVKPTSAATELIYHQNK